MRTLSILIELEGQKMNIRMYDASRALQPFEQKLNNFGSKTDYMVTKSTYRSRLIRLRVRHWDNQS